MAFARAPDVYIGKRAFLRERASKAADAREGENTDLEVKLEHDLAPASVNIVGKKCSCRYCEPVPASRRCSGCGWRYSKRAYAQLANAVFAILNVRTVLQRPTPFARLCSDTVAAEPF